MAQDGSFESICRRTKRSVGLNDLAPVFRSIFFIKIILINNQCSLRPDGTYIISHRNLLILPFLPFQEFETTSPQPQRRIYPDSFQQHLHVSTASLAFVKTFRPERFLRVRGSSYFAREMESSRGRRGFVPVTNDPRDENTRKGYVAECTDDGSVTGATHRPSPTSSRVIKFT